MYVELRAHSAFSFLRGGSLPEDLIARAAALGHTAIALGDRNGVYGAPRFHQAGKAAGVRAIVGAELRIQAVRLLGCYAVRGKKGVEAGGPNSQQPNSLTAYLLPTTRTAYKNLCRLLTQASLRAPKGEATATWEDIEGHTEGLICLAGGRDGPLARAEDPLAVVEQLRRLFGAGLYVDLQRHFDPAEERVNRRLLAIARAAGVPIVATNGVRHATPEGRALYDVLTCIREKTTLDQAGRLLASNAERHLKSAREMAALFRDLPEAVANSERIAERCEFTLADLGYGFPDYPLPAGETQMSHLRSLTRAGAHGRWGEKLSARVRRQLQHELAIIEKLELAGYFLIVWDIVRYCRERGILAQGRGSAANSAVCYALGITAVDAVGMELLFERFLSEERGEWPDIDIDLPSGDRREEVIQYVYRRYGERGAAMTANVITYRTRSAVREVGKALGFSLEQVDKLAKLLNRFEFRDDLDELPMQLRAGGVDPTSPRVRQLVDLVARMQNLPRHLGQHSGGMVIAAGRLDEVVPLEPASMPGRVVVQWDKDDCADLGIIKVDLLGLGMMAVLQDAVPLIREHEGVEIDYAKLPPDDAKVYGMLQRADTIGVFQVESRAQMATLPRMRPERFYDLVVEVAIIRPGPIVGQMVHPYLSRRAGREPVTYAHPCLEPILERTLGVPLFQEQLLRIAMEAAGFSGGEAEELRRAMGFKRSTERMKAIEQRLRAGMAARGIIGEAADDIVRGITSFALYGFPESHAASFALIAYASAYLKAHHPAAFACALLNNFPMGFYHPATIVKDAQRHGVRVLAVDVSQSAWMCALEGGGGLGEAVRLLGCYAVRGRKGEEAGGPNSQQPNSLTAWRGEEGRQGPALRLGLKCITGLREEAGKRIEEERTKTPFTSIEDIARRCQLRDDELASLAEAGALAAFGRTRREAMWQSAGLQRGELFEAGGNEAVRLLGCHAVREEKGEEGGGGLTANSLTANSLSRSRRNDEREHEERDPEALLPRPPRLAPIDGTGERLLPADEEFPAGRVVWNGESASKSGNLGAGEHRRGQRTQDEERLSAVSPHRSGQFAGSRDLSDPRSRGFPDDARSRRSIAEQNSLDSETAEPPHPVDGPLAERLAPNSQRPNSLTASIGAEPSPLPEMSQLERTLADYRTTGMTAGPQVMAYLREDLQRDGVLSARELKRARHGRWVKIAGLVIVRQRPGTAKGFCFLTLEDETGTSNAVVVPDMFQRHRTIIHTAALLQVEGPVQIVDDVIHVRARKFTKLSLPRTEVTQRGHGYRMRVTPADEEEETPMPKSHDFR